MRDLLEKISRWEGSHKGQNGRIGIIGGSRDYAGAPALTGRAALRTGSDLAKISTAESVKDTVASYSENLIVGGYSGDYFNIRSLPAVRDLREWVDVLVVGPGLSDPGGALAEFVEESDKPMVLDAEAIEPGVRNGVKAVYTPHPKEAEVIEEEYGSLESFVEETGSVVLLKGSVDKIYSEDGVEKVDRGNPGMTVGGTGDVLAGIVGSLMGQGLEPEEAAYLGAWINGSAGDQAFKKYGNGLLPTDIIDLIPGQMS